MTPTLSNNSSNTAEDNRSIQRIVFEKAQFGAVPWAFKVTGDDRWHPVAWSQNPDLMTISFSDGTYVHVMPENHIKEANGPATQYDKPDGEDVRWDRPVLGTGFPGNEDYPVPATPPSPAYGAVRADDDALDQLGDAIATTAATELIDSMNDVGAADSPRKLGEAEAKALQQTREIAKKFAPSTGAGKPKGFA